jgi:hypothetical protein
MIASLIGPFVIAALFLALAFRQSRKLGYAARDRLAAERAKTVAALAGVAAARSTRAPQPAAAAAAVSRPAAPAAARPRLVPPGEFLPAPGSSAGVAAPLRRARRARVKRWTAEAVIAAEVLGPPVGLRPGGTLGPPAAF